MVVSRLPLILVALVAAGCPADRSSSPAASSRPSATAPGVPASVTASVTASAAAPASASAAPASTDPRRRWSFDDAEPGSLPAPLSPAVGEWKVVRVPDGGRVLGQLAVSEDAVFNVVLLEGIALADVDLRVRLRAVTGRVDQGGGLLWRAADRNNYYVARYNPLEDNLRLYFVKEGRRKMLQGKTLRIDHAAWHGLRVTMVGDHVRVYLDDELHLEAHDLTFPEAGTIGLWTKADAKTHFDDLEAAR